jgi:predicted GIY-YIG superfamily endonuclease
MIPRRYWRGLVVHPAKLARSGTLLVGVTGDLRSRLKRHNAGEVSHTSKYAPWKIKTYVAFSDES